MLEIENLHTYRGDSYVLQGVSLHVPDGRCVTLLGRNGMGKTTLIRSIMGLTPPRSGRIVWGGGDLSGLPPYAIARRGLAMVPQGRWIFPSLTVEENLSLGARRDRAAGNTGGWTVEEMYALFPHLKERRHNRGGQLSGGEQQMLAIGRALMTNPRLLLMDEPSEGLAPVIVDRMEELIRDLRSRRLSILLVEQNYGLGVSLADHVYVLANGLIVWDGAAGALEAAPQVRQQFLGV
jgi:branched-chain amino acid transport system ATP-binding protein